MSAAIVVAAVEGLPEIAPGQALEPLLEAGLPPDAFDDTGACTACERDWYFSHRRDAGHTGRLWGFAALRARHQPARPHRHSHGL